MTGYGWYPPATLRGSLLVKFLLEKAEESPCERDHSLCNQQKISEWEETHSFEIAQRDSMFFWAGDLTIKSLVRTLAFSGVTFCTHAEFMLCCTNTTRTYGGDLGADNRKRRGQGGATLIQGQS